MSTFLEKILGYTRFIDTNPNYEFLPRRLGLGYSQETIELDKTVLKSVRKQTRIENQLAIEKDINKRAKGNMKSKDAYNSTSNSTEDSTEEVNKQDFISKKAKKR